MARSANRTTHPIETPRTCTQNLYATLVGAATADLTMSTQEALNGEIVSAVHTGTGKYTVTFRYVYPELKRAPVFGFIGTTDGLIAQFASLDITTGTGALEIYVGSTPTDLATTDTITIDWVVRNSGKNK